MNLAQKEDITTYANTVELHFFRLLLYIHIWCRGAVCSLDVKEAFTQTTESASKTFGTGSRIFLRLPSQWKGNLAPEIISKLSSKDKASQLLEVLRSIYGQATAPLCWLKTFVSFLIDELGFSVSQYDECILFKLDIPSGHYIYIALYVDDVWFMSLCSSAAEAVALKVTERFLSTEISWLCGQPGLDWHVGQECIFVTQQYSIISEESELFLKVNQSDYMSNAVHKLIEKQYVTEEVATRNLTLLDSKIFVHQTLSQDCAENPLLSSSEQTALRGILNTLAYATTTRPELAAAIQTVARGQATGRQRHLAAAIKLIQYSWTFRDRGFRFPIPSNIDRKNMQLWITTDFDASLGNAGPLLGSGDSQVRLEGDGHARMGCCMFVAVGNCSSPREANQAGWCFFSRSALQPTISIGTTESELTSCSWACKETIGATNFSREVLREFIIRLPTLYGDNEAANLVANGQCSVRAVRHLVLQRLYARQVCKEGQCNVRSKRSMYMTADMFTKIVDRITLERLLKLLFIT